MAARNIVLQFGELVSIPLKKEGAVEKPQAFVGLCTGFSTAPHAPSPRRQPPFCGACDEHITDQVIVKGLKQGNTYVVITQEEVTEAKTSYSNAYKDVISLVAHPAGEFLAQTAAGESLSFLTPASEAVANQYQTLVAFITDHPELAFVGLNTPSSVTSLFQVKVRDGVLVMEQRIRSQALKATPSVGGTVMSKLQMFLDMTLEDSLTDYSPDAYEDGYLKAIDALAAESGRLVASSSTPVETAIGVTDLDMLAKLAALGAPTRKPKKSNKKAA